ncbi:MAG: DMT family transporter [Gammaproteobacteria bacterium]|nr:DMT family transporter [Gammaproteobacteria bacterium]
MSNESKGMLLGVLGVVAFGLTLPATRYVVPHLDPVFIGLGRAVLAAVFAALLLLITRQPLPDKFQFYKLLVIASGVVVGFPVLSAWAMQTAPSSHGGVVLGILPLATAVAGVLISNERPSAGFWLSGAAGCAVVVLYSLRGGAGSFQPGDLALLGAVASAAVGYAVGGQLSREIGGWQVICWALVISLPFIALPAWIQAPENGLNIPVNIWMAFLYLALVSQLFGFFLWNKGLALGGIARVSQAQLVQPFVTIIASAILVNEAIDATTILFALMVVGWVAIGKRMPIHANN